MTAVSATVTSKGQVTIPRSIRQLLHLNPGDTLVFEPVKKNLIHLRAHVRSGGLEGCLRDRPRAAVRPATEADIAESIAEACRRHL